MLAVHAVWSVSGRLGLWAEDPELPAAAPPLRGREAGLSRAGKARPRAHPFACPAERLRAVLNVDPAEGADGGELVLLLPSWQRGPLSSPELVRGTASSAHTARGLRPWRVPVLMLSPRAAARLLLAVPRTVRAGASLRYLGEVAKLACEPAAAGRVLPGLATERGTPVARWRAVPAGADAQRLALLERALPPVCRAEWQPDGDDAELEGRPPHVLVEQALAGLVDGVVRAALAGRSLLPPGQEHHPAQPSAAGAWLAALTADDPTVDTDAAGLSGLAGALEAWWRSALPSGRLRTCFRLEPPAKPNGTPVTSGIPEPAEPAATGGPDQTGGPDATGAAPPGTWRLELLLQSVEDPSLLVPAAEVWRSGARLALPGGAVEAPQERMLADLGQASRLYPELEQVLEQRRPAALELDARGAHRFLSEAAGLLSQAGFGVLTPSWWRTPAARLGLKLTAASREPAEGSAAAGRVGFDRLVDYSWQVALGDDTLTPEELRELARLKQPLVAVRGRWVELDQQELERALAFLERQPDAGTDGGTGGDGAAMAVPELLRAALGLEETGAGLPVVSVEADGWFRDLLDAAGDARLEPTATPAGFHGQLRGYQEQSLAWLAFHDRLGLGACLALDMGLGKTPVTLGLLAAERAAAGRRPGPTLLVCPMSVVGNWQRETERFTPGLAVHVHHGAERLGGEEFRAAVTDADLVITTYALAARDRDVLAGVTWARVVLDEAQNIKNAAARQTQAIRSLPADRRLALTGTPVENRLAELWSIMEFCNPGLLGSATAFRERFALPVERFGDDEAAALLKRLTGPFILRRTKTDRSVIADLPAKLEMKVYCNLTREQATLYQAVVDDMIVKVADAEGMQRKGQVLAAMSRLKQVCNHPAQLLADASGLAGRSGKLALLEELLEEALAAGDSALVFTQFAAFGHRLQTHLAERFGQEILYLHGGTPKKTRDELVARFQDGGPAVFLLSLKAGGTGLNLTAANHVIHFDRWWNPAVEDQATDRAFRIGQRRDVQVRKLVCVGTLEERIDQMIEDKRGLAARIVGGGESWLTELSTDALRDLVTLRAEAVVE